MSRAHARRVGPAAALVAAALVASGCASPFFDTCIERAPATEAPLLWRAQRANPRGGALYLFGSVHVGTGAALELPAAIEGAWQSAAELVVEVDSTELADPRVAREMAARGLLEPPTRLQDVISAETLELLQQRLSESGVPFSRVEGMKPWLVTTTLVVLELQSLGFDAEHGVDRTFLARAEGAVPVRALESTEAQVELLDGLPMPLQEILLVDALSRGDSFTGATEQLLDAWRRGDERQLEELVFRAAKDNPDFEAFYEAIFYTRNETMSRDLAELARDGKDRFVVLGAGHMLGPRGIPRLLCDAGFRLERLSGGG